MNFIDENIDENMNTIKNDSDGSMYEDDVLDQDVQIRWINQQGGESQHSVLPVTVPRAVRNGWQSEEQLKMLENLLDPTAKDAIAEWRLRDGLDPDAAEFERLRTPPYPIVEDDLSDVLHRRVVIVESLTMAELSHPRLLEVMSHCNEFQVTYVYKENSAAETHSNGNFTSLWEGMVILFLPSVTDALKASKYLQAMRDDVEIRLLQAKEHIGHLIDTWRGALKDSMRRLTDDVLIVSNITSSITKEKLQEVFTDALDIVVPYEWSSEIKTLKGFAYLTFGSRSRMQMAFDRYSSQEILVSGHVLRISKYEPPIDIPIGYLRLRRRLRILDLIRHLRAAEADADAEGLSEELLCRLSQHVSKWTALIDKDNTLRLSMKLPTPSLEELHVLFQVPLRTHTTPMDEDDINELLAKSKGELAQLKEMKSVHLASKSSFLRHEAIKPPVWKKTVQPTHFEDYSTWPVDEDDDMESCETGYRWPEVLVKKYSPIRSRGRFRFRGAFQSRLYGRHPRRRGWFYQDRV